MRFQIHPKMVVLEVGQYNLSCMALLDRANTETYGQLQPAALPLRVRSSWSAAMICTI